MSFGFFETVCKFRNVSLSRLTNRYDASSVLCYSLAGRSCFCLQNHQRLSLMQFLLIPFAVARVNLHFVKVSLKLPIKPQCSAILQGQGVTICNFWGNFLIFVSLCGNQLAGILFLSTSLLILITGVGEPHPFF